MEGDRPEREQQASRHAKASSWLEGIFGVLGLAWFVILFAIGFHIGPLVSQFERYRVLFGGLEVLGGLVLVCASLQIPPFRQRPISWPTCAYNIVSAAGFMALTYSFEVALFPTLPNPGGGALPAGTLLIVFASFRVPSRLLTWINRQIRGIQTPRSPADPG
ncbi:MAG TPA: hypothetical protein VF116_17885 [Ktedonobacterales bacterium]